MLVWVTALGYARVITLYHLMVATAFLPNTTHQSHIKCSEIFVAFYPITHAK